MEVIVALVVGIMVSLIMAGKVSLEPLVLRTGKE